MSGLLGCGGVWGVGRLLDGYIIVFGSGGDVLVFPDWFSFLSLVTWIPIWPFSELPLPEGAASQNEDPVAPRCVGHDRPGSSALGRSVQRLFLCGGSE